MITLIHKEENQAEAVMVLEVDDVTIEVAAQHDEQGLRLEWERVYPERR